MSVNKQRIRKVNSFPIGSGPVVYWMNRELRSDDNWALLYAQELALEQKVPLVVVYNLVAGFLGGGLRQWMFKLGGLRELERTLQTKNIPLFLILDEAGPDGETSPTKLLELFESVKAGAVVTDFSPLRSQLAWVRTLKDKLNSAFFTVDAHNIVPVWVASDKEEWAAYTLRPKLYRLLPEYLETFPVIKKHPYLFSGAVPEIHWATLEQHPKIDHSVTVTDFVPGERAAQKALKGFIDTALARYAAERNDPNAHAQSNLSPYFHYGMLAPERAVLEVLTKVHEPIEEVLHAAKNKAKVDEKVPLRLIDHASAFLEELIIRRELADNFCFYNKNYDSTAGFADWAKKSHAKTKDEKRDYLYSREQFERGKTHDELWNAAQNEMVKSGKMHGYMRMYWAKKILEWTSGPEEAMQIAIYLNDKYELDGRDPNGYAGIAWSIGGVHDRAWFSRPIFGTIRYMARSGCEKKFDVKRYIERWQG